LPTPAMRGGDLSNILGPQVALSACNPTPVKEPPPPPLPCSDAIGRPVFQGELYDPSTARSVAPGAVDAVTGLPTATVNPDGTPATSPWLLRDAFGFDNLTGLPIAGAANIIPTGRIDPVAAKIFSYFPDPVLPGQRFGYTNNWIISNETMQNTSQWGVKIDHSISDKDRVSGEFITS